jgi:hypothetical protein
MKRRGFVPSSISGFSQQDFLDAVTEEIESYILPKLVKANSKHLLRTEDQSITANQSQYRVPARCANNGIYSVWLVNSSNGFDRLEEIDPGDVPKTGITLNANTPRFYAWEGPFLTLYPTPIATAGTLRIKYQVRPSKLVLVTAVGTITGTPVAGASTVTVGSASPSSTSGPFDIVRGTGAFEHLGIDLAGSRASTTITLTAGVPAVPNLPVAGDYVCNAGESPVPQLPTGLHLPAALRGVASIISSKGNKALAEVLLGEAVAAEKEVLESLVPRNQTNQQDLANPWW